MNITGNSHSRKRTLRDRLFSRTERLENGCLIFTGYRTKQGYGQIGTAHATAAAHRVAWELANGPIPKGKFVCHTCDNPPCIEITHLWLGTPKQNAGDMKSKGRGRGAEGRRNANARLTWEQVAEIRARHKRFVHCDGPEGYHSAGQIAKEYGITTTYVCQLVRETWRRNA